MDANQELERAAVEEDPGAPAEEKAARLRERLEKQIEESRAKEDDDLDSAAAAPSRSGDGVAEHERDMLRRGFERQGPPD